jgi:hypothetical protein
MYDDFALLHPSRMVRFALNVARAGGASPESPWIPYKKVLTTPFFSTLVIYTALCNTLGMAFLYYISAFYSSSPPHSTK